MLISDAVINKNTEREREYKNNNEYGYKINSTNVQIERNENHASK